MIDLPNIAFIGRAGAGKSTCAQWLMDNYGYEKLSFAAPLKAGCGTMTDRALLQKVGQGVRDLHEDFWVNLLLADMRETLWHDDDRRFVVDDCRYPNEASALKAEGFLIVRVLAPRNVRVSRLRANGKLGDEAELEHVSETALDWFADDYVVYNHEAELPMAERLTWILNREAR